MTLEQRGMQARALCDQLAEAAESMLPNGFHYVICVNYFDMGANQSALAFKANESPPIAADLMESTASDMREKMAAGSQSRTFAEKGTGNA